MKMKNVIKNIHELFTDNQTDDVLALEIKNERLLGIAQPKVVKKPENTILQTAHIQIRRINQKVPNLEIDDFEQY